MGGKKYIKGGKKARIAAAKKAKAAAEAAAKAAEEAAAAEAARAALLGTDAKVEEDVTEKDTLLAGISVTFAAQKYTHSNVKDIKIANLNVGLYGHELLVESELNLNWGRRYGLIGPNGCGKSTLLKILGRRMVDLPDNIDSFHLVEECEPSDMTALQAVLTVDEERRKIESEVDRLGDLLGSVEDMEESSAINDRLCDLYERLDEMGAETAEMRAAKILWGLGFTKQMQQKRTRDFSGGWRMRIALARALFINPSLLLLDEPTNHLDMEAVLWLEGYLAQFPKILFIISHSQDFMNNVCTNIVHMHQQKLITYGGNYDTYRQTRAEKEEHQMKRYNWEQDQIKHMKEYIARFGHGSAKLAKQAQSKEKTLAKMERAGLTARVHTEATLTMTFTDPGKIPPPVMQITDLTFAYPGGETLYKNVDFGIDLDSRIALVGANGAGKSTLLKLLTGELIPTSGNIRPHQHLRMAMYTQHFVDTLDLTVTPLEHLRNLYPDDSVDQCRSYIGRFGVTGRFQTTIMDHLSDGIKSRVVFALMARRNPHILLLDEPTNHLDIETIDALAESINKFKGGVVLVSHDMRLISQVAREIYEVENRSINKFDGDIMAYKDKLRRYMAKQTAKQESSGWTVTAGDAGTRRDESKEAKTEEVKPKKKKKPSQPPIVVANTAPGGAPAVVAAAAPRGAKGWGSRATKKSDDGADWGGDSWR